MVDQAIGASGEAAEKAITASSASQTGVSELLTTLGFVVKEMDVTVYPSSAIARFNWVGEENRDMSATKLFIEDGLKSHGVLLGRGGFKVHDVHSRRDLLNFHSESIHVSASTDMIVAPYSTPATFLPPQSCILFELKTKGTELSSNEPQAIVELLAARVASEQPNVAVILTDLCTGAIAYTFAFASTTEVFVLQRHSLAPEQIFPFSAHFLREHCKPDATYRASVESADPKAECVLEFRNWPREGLQRP